MFILPQIQAGAVRQNDAVRLWDGVNNANVCGLTGALPSPGSDDSVFTTQGTISMWLYYSNNENEQIWLAHSLQNAADDRGFQFTILPFAQQIRFICKDISGNNIIFAFQSISFSPLQWNHIMVTWDIFNNPRRVRFAVNGVATAEDSVSNSFTAFQRGYFGINNIQSGLENPAVARLAIYDFWLGSGFTDLTSPANIEKFRTSSGSPVKLTQIIQGIGQARVFLSGSFNSWRTNKGNAALSELTITENTAYFTKSPTKPT